MGAMPGSLRRCELRKHFRSVEANENAVLLYFVSLVDANLSKSAGVFGRDIHPLDFDTAIRPCQPFRHACGLILEPIGVATGRAGYDRNNDQDRSNAHGGDPLDAEAANRTGID